jgi:hypothetical protein
LLDFPLDKLLAERIEQDICSLLSLAGCSLAASSSFQRLQAALNAFGLEAAVRMVSTRLPVPAAQPMATPATLGMQLASRGVATGQLDVGAVNFLSDA